MFASVRKYFPPSPGHEFIPINSISYTVVSASLLVSASLRPGYEIMPINFQTYLVNNSQTDPLIVKMHPPLALLAIPAYHMLLFHLLFIVWCWLCLFWTRIIFVKFDKIQSNMTTVRIKRKRSQTFSKPNINSTSNTVDDNLKCHRDTLFTTLWP